MRGNMDSKRVLLAIQEKLKWEGRKARIEEKLGQLRERKGMVLRQIEETRTRVSQLTAVGALSESERPSGSSALRIENLR